MANIRNAIYTAAKIKSYPKRIPSKKISSALDLIIRAATAHLDEIM
jgi:hypothetical protein